MLTVTVCVGSSCHVKGARDVIVRFQKLLAESSLEDRVELKGSFCMELCAEGINWKVDEEVFSSPSVEDAVRTFQEKVIAVAKAPAAQTGEAP